MRKLAAFSACALLALAAPAFAANAETPTMKHELKANGSADGAGYSHAKQHGDRGTEDGRAPKVEGRASAMDQGSAHTGATTGGMGDSATGTGMMKK